MRRQKDNLALPDAHTALALSNDRLSRSNATIMQASVNGQHGGVVAVMVLAEHELVKISLIPPVVGVQVGVLLDSLA